MKIKIVLGVSIMMFLMTSCASTVGTSIRPGQPQWKAKKTFNHSHTWEWKNGKARRMRAGERPSCIDAW